MHIPSNRTRRDMQAVAELRTAGATWDTIGEVLGRHPYVLRRWTHVYRDEWDGFIHDAEERVCQKRSEYARAAVRLALRHESPRVRRAAAENLRCERRAEQAKEPIELRAKLPLALRAIDEMSDEEIDKCVAEYFRPGRGESAQGTPP
jgi:hypothetical protein